MIERFVCLLILCALFQTGQLATGGADGTPATADDISTPNTTSPIDHLSLFGFSNMIKCYQPDESKQTILRSYADYGCYCGKGGSGWTLDETDRCCFVHDNCYSDSHALEESLFDVTYTVDYEYECKDQKVF